MFSYPLCVPPPTSYPDIVQSVISVLFIVVPFLWAELPIFQAAIIFTNSLVSCPSYFSCHIFWMCFSCCWSTSPKMYFQLWCLWNKRSLGFICSPPSLWQHHQLVLCICGSLSILFVFKIPHINEIIWYFFSIWHFI